MQTPITYHQEQTSSMITISAKCKVNNKTIGDKAELDLNWLKKELLVKIETLGWNTEISNQILSIVLPHSINNHKESMRVKLYERIKERIKHENNIATE